MTQKNQISKDPKTEKYSAPALSKGLDILEFLACQSTGMRKAEISQALDRTVNEIYRMLAVLVSRGYVMLDEDTERYSLTMRMFELSHNFPPTNRLTSVAGPIMEDAALKLNQSVHLAILNGAEILVVGQVTSSGNNFTAVRLGARVPLVLTSSGACLLHRDSPEDRNNICRQHERFSTKAQNVFEKSVTQVQKTGSCESPSSVIEGIINLSVPIFGFGGDVKAALTIPYIKRLEATSDPDLQACKELLIETGKSISKKIGAGATPTI